MKSEKQLLHYKHMTNYKVDIFRLLKNISNNNMEFIDNLSEDEINSISPYVVQLWMKGADNNTDARNLLMNQVSNPYIFSLGEHKSLLLKLLCVANGFEIDTRFTFRNKKKQQKSETINMLMDYYQCRREHARQYAALLTHDEIITRANEMGCDAATIKKIEKES